MGLLLFGFGGFNFGNQTLCFCRNPKKFICQSVRKFAQCMSSGKRLLITDGKVDQVSVDCFIANKTTCGGQRKKVVRKPKFIDPYFEVFSLDALFINHALNTHSEHRTSRSGRGRKDTLGFVEYLFGRIRHTGFRTHFVPGRIDKFFIFPECDLSAICASHDAVVAWVHKVEKILELEVLIPVSERICSHSYRAFVFKRDQVLFKLTNNSAMRATK